MPPTSPRKPADNSALLQEVRALATSVSLLHAVFVRRKVLYAILAIESAIVVCALTVAGVFIYLNANHTDKIVGQLVDTCSVRNAQIDATKTYLKRTQELQVEGQAINAKLLNRLNLHLSAKDRAEFMKINQEYSKVLHDYFVAQPNDITCKAYKTGG